MANGHVIDIIIQTNDQTQTGLASAKKAILRFDQGVQRTSQRISQLTQKTHNITVNLIDRVTTPGGQINQRLKAITARPFNFMLNLNDRATSGIRLAENRLFQLTGRVHTVALNLRDNATQGLKNISNTLLGSTLGVGVDMLAGAGLAYGVYDSIKTFKDFEQQMSAVAAISGASKSELEALTAKAKEMGAITSFSATQSGKAFEYMAMAGWKTEDMIGGIAGIMNLAAASGEELANVSDIVTDALTAFGLQAKDSARFADVLAAASSNSNTSVGMMGYTFKYAAPLAGALKYSIEDIAIATGLMANAGIKGEQAGTSLRMMMTSLIDPSKEATNEMERLGIKMKNADNTMRPFRAVISDLRTAFSKLSEVEKTQAASTLVGQSAMSGFLAVVNAASSDFNKLKEAIDGATGVADRMAKTRMDNLAGDLEQLGGAWETFQLNIMAGSNSNFIRDFVQSLIENLDNINTYIKDGFDITDVGRLTLDVVQQLIDKFKALDGVGSILAGGVLAGGLAKITSQAMKLTNNLKVPILSTGETGGIGGGQHVSSMVIHAQNVVLNNSGLTGGTVPAGGIPPAGDPTTTTSQGGRMARFMRNATRVGGLLTLVMGAYNIYDQIDANEKSLAMADINIEERSNAYNEVKLRGEDTTQAGKELYMAYQNREAVNKQNTEKLNTSIGTNSGMVAGGVAGATLGAKTGGVVGAFLGGVGAAPGAAVGGLIGGALGAFGGSELGKTLGSHWTGVKEEASNTVEWICKNVTDKFEEVTKPIKDTASYAHENLWIPLKSNAVDFVNFWVGLFAVIGNWTIENVWNPIADYVDMKWADLVNTIREAKAQIIEAWGVASEWFEVNVWSPIVAVADYIWSCITDKVSTAWNGVSSVWNEASTWFVETVWSPVSNSTEEVQIAITEAFQSAFSFVQDLWGGATEWFDSKVINPIRNKFNEIKNIGASITNLGSSSIGGSVSAHAAGGIFHVPHHALVGEAGSEAIIPLSPSRRNTALYLFNRTAELLGISEGNESEDDFFNQPISSVGMKASASTVTISLGGVSSSFNIVVREGQDADSIMSVIRSNLESLSDEIGGKIAEKVAAIHFNQPLIV